MKYPDIFDINHIVAEAMSKAKAQKWTATAFRQNLVEEIDSYLTQIWQEQDTLEDIMNILTNEEE